MKRTKQVKETVAIGSGANEIRIVTEHNGAEAPAALIVDGWEVTLKPEDIERVAAALEEMRHQAGDYRRVCPDHGYYNTRVVSGTYECPSCRAAEERKADERHAAADVAMEPLS